MDYSLFDKGYRYLQLQLLKKRNVLSLMCFTFEKPIAIVRLLCRYMTYSDKSKY